MEEELERIATKVINLDGIRKKIADHLSYSTQTTARASISMKVDMLNAQNYYEVVAKEIQESTGIKLNVTGLLVKAAARALEKHPILNSILIKDKIYVIGQINVGVAVALENALVVPVIRNANNMSLAEIARFLSNIVRRVRERALSPEEVGGGTFTITNLGSLGIDMLAPIINVPETAILGVGGMTQSPVVVNGEIRIRPIITLNLCWDHRAFDGMPAAKFLVSLKEILESGPSAL
jgi:pyruvate dehydrogenase E2 component (dihydrolipoamide acetyltransferase)